MDKDSAEFKDLAAEFDALPMDERKSRVVDILEVTLDHYEEANPDWKEKILLSILLGALDHLRLSLEDEDAPDISWDVPLAVFQYPVEWDWEEMDASVVVEVGGRRGRLKPGAAPYEDMDGQPREAPWGGWGSMIAGIIKDDEITDLETAWSAAVHVAVEHIHLFLVKELTNGLVEWHEKRRSSEDAPKAFVLPMELQVALNTAGLEGEERAKVIDELSKPFLIGAADLKLEKDKLRNPEALPEAVRQALPEKLKVLPRILFEVHHEEVRALGPDPTVEDLTASKLVSEGVVVGCFHPLVVDVDERRAYFPVEVGLILKEGQWFTAWGKKDREALWDNFSFTMDTVLSVDSVKVGVSASNVTLEKVDGPPLPEPMVKAAPTAFLTFSPTVTRAQVTNVVQAALEADAQEITLSGMDFETVVGATGDDIPKPNDQELLKGAEKEGASALPKRKGFEKETIRLFYSYSHRDEALREELATHLKILERTGVIETWYDRKIEASDGLKTEIDKNLERADIILLLVSPDFIASDYCWKIEMPRALERHHADEARVIPVILRPVKLDSAPFAEIVSLPEDRKPVTTWSNRDSAWKSVSDGIERVARRLRSGTK